MFILRDLWHGILTTQDPVVGLVLWFVLFALMAYALMLVLALCRLVGWLTGSLAPDPTPPPPDYGALDRDLARRFTGQSAGAGRAAPAPGRSVPPRVHAAPATPVVRRAASPPRHSAP